MLLTKQDHIERLTLLGSAVSMLSEKVAKQLALNPACSELEDLKLMVVAKNILSTYKLDSNEICYTGDKINILVDFQLPIAKKPNYSYYTPILHELNCNAEAQYGRKVIMRVYPVNGSIDPMFEYNSMIFPCDANFLGLDAFMVNFINSLGHQGLAAELINGKFNWKVSSGHWVVLLRIDDDNGNLVDYFFGDPNVSNSGLVHIPGVTNLGIYNFTLNLHTGSGIFNVFTINDELLLEDAINNINFKGLTATLVGDIVKFRYEPEIDDCTVHHLEIILNDKIETIPFMAEVIPGYYYLSEGSDGCLTNKQLQSIWNYLQSKYNFSFKPYTGILVSDDTVLLPAPQGTRPLPMTNVNNDGVMKWITIYSGLTLQSNYNYITASSSLLEVILSTGTPGTTIRVAGSGTGGWRINLSGVTILFHDEIVSNFVASDYHLDSIELLCVTPDTWNVISTNGNIQYD